MRIPYDDPRLLPPQLPRCMRADAAVTTNISATPVSSRLAAAVAAADVAAAAVRR